MGNVAHELRTPIFAIQLSLETLLDGAVNDEKVNIDFLDRAFNQTKRLKSLVDDLISISKFEARFENE
ncbi:MAG: histidine kinase dimerization/phospho-acceptor domain-containing protein [Ignavibacteria bacterium]